MLKVTRKQLFILIILIGAIFSSLYLVNRKKNLVFVDLNDNYGIYITDNTERNLPLSSIKETYRDDRIGTKYTGVEAEKCAFEVPSIFKSNLQANRFGMESQNLLVQKSIVKPVYIQIASGSETSCSLWDYKWEDTNNHVSFPLPDTVSTANKNTQAVSVSFIHVNNEDIVTSYITYEFLIYNSLKNGK